MGECQLDWKKVPNNEYSMSGNRIAVKALDLNTDFANLAGQLDNIVNSFYFMKN